MTTIFKKIKFHTKFILNHEHRFKLALGYGLIALKINHFFIIKKAAYKIYFSRNVLALNIFADPKNRDDEEFIIQSLLKKEATYIDIGANIGTLCLAANNRVNNLKIYAFEACSSTYKNLKRNFKLNKLTDATTYQIALGEKNQEIKFSNLGSDDQNRVIKNNENVGKSVYLEMKTLDRVAIFPKISLLKIDVEGYELFVLKGAAKNLKNCEAIYFEYSPINTAKYHYQAVEIINLLETLNFSIYIPQISQDQVKLTNFSTQDHQTELNLLAINNNFKTLNHLEILS